MGQVSSSHTQGSLFHDGRQAFSETTERQARERQPDERHQGRQSRVATTFLIETGRPRRTFVLSRRKVEEEEEEGQALMIRMMMMVALATIGRPSRG